MCLNIVIFSLNIFLNAGLESESPKDTSQNMQKNTQQVSLLDKIPNADPAAL